MAILYRKYRPQNFSDFYGQEHLVETLLNEIKNDKIAHAYLFSGPRGTGKTSLARLFAKAINCQNRKENEAEPCNECSHCQEISESRNLDVIEMDAASHTGVDNVRENIIDNSRFKPTGSPYKIFIIDEVHMLSTSAFNALLKTLEEPPKHAIFILATTEWHKIPATIISRCQRFNFKKIPFDLIKKKLKNISKEEGIKVDEEVLKKVIIKSEGCMRDAESLLGQLFSLGLEKITLENSELILPNVESEKALNFLEKAEAGESSEAISIVNELSQNGSSLDEFASQVIELLRQIMIGKTDLVYFNDLDFSDDSKKRMRKIAEEKEMGKIVRDLEAAIKRKSEIKTSPIPNLPLEILAIEIAGGINLIETKIEQVPVQKITIKVEEEKKEVTPVENTPENIEEVKKEIKTEEPKSEVSGSVDIGEVKNKWADFLKEVTEVCPSLVFILNMAEIRQVNSNQIQLAVGYSFHQEKLEQPTNRQKLEDILKKVMGQPMSFSCSIDNSVGKNHDDLSDLALQFGGEVV